MIFSLFGFSLLLHLTIIFSAAIYNRLVSGKKHHSAFQTYHRHGGWLGRDTYDIAASYAIVTLVGTYILSTLLLTLVAAWRIGADEPQVVLAKSIIGHVVTAVSMIMINEFFFVTAALGTAVLISFILFRPLIELARPPVTQFASTVTAIFITIVTTLRGWVLIVLAGSLLAIPAIAGAQIVEPGFESEVVASGLTLPTATAFAPDGRIFIAEKNGTVKVVKNGNLLSTPLITLTDINTFGDRGLIGMTIDPNFENNGYLYLSYTYENTPGFDIGGPKTARIVRVTVIGDQASESSKVVLVGTVGGNASAQSCEDFAVTADCIPSDSNSHSAGALAFGPDGKLYASTGDGADFAAVDSRALRAQNIDSLAGKVLRINPDGTAPSDNPFFNGDPDSNRSKVYALGFRNMFRITFNPDTGRLYGSDVGWSDWEEINEVVPGANYGWPCREGDGPQSEYDCTPTTTWTDPLYTYPHNAQGAGSVTVGAFPENGVYPAQYDDSLFFGDYAQMWLKRVVIDDTTGEFVSVHDFESGVFPVEIRAGSDGNVYYIDIVAGELRRITHTDGNRRPVINMDATPDSGLAPLTVNFSSAGTYDPDGDAIGTVWNFDDGTFTTNPNPTHTFAEDGTYEVTLTVADSQGASVVQSLTITVGDQAPTAVITTPDNGSFYNALENVMVMGDATDPEDGTLPASAFEWEVILHHNVHTHPVQQFSDTKMINFVADNHDDNDVYMEVILTVTDSAGLTDTTSINMYLNQAASEGNLIANPSLEDVDPALASQPRNWVTGWYGSMNPIFTYPVNGLSGEKAAQIQVSGYSFGAARWYFSPVFVEAGETYEHSHLYTANATTSVTIQYARPDGTYLYNFLGTVPPAADPTTVSYTIDVPENVETMSIFHDLYSNGTLTVDEYSLEKPGTGETDTNPPTGEITNLSEGDTVSGTTTVEIMAMDAEGPVTMVHLYVDGTKVEGLEDTTAPFSLEWDTTQFANGPHVIQTHMHDVPDNHGLSDPITVYVNNRSTSTSNLVANGDFESLDSGGVPTDWTPGGWGSHERDLSVVPGVYGNAARTEITSYTLSDTGDAKWRHDPIAVSPGVEYTFSTYYRSDTISDVIAQYEMADGSYFYQGIVKEVQPNPDWTLASGTTIAPENAVSMTAFHLISSEGYLEIDNVAIVAGAGGNQSETNPPLVAWESHGDGDVVSGTVTFVASSSDDTAVLGVYYGVNGTFTGTEDTTAPYTLTLDTTTYPDGEYILKATSHDPYGNNDKAEITVTFDNSGASGTTTPPNEDNLITNGGFETFDASGNPTGWREGGYGVNDTIYDIVTTSNGNNVAYVEIFNYVSGDAKWVFDEVPVTGGATYRYSVDYASRNQNEVVAFYTLTDGTTRAELIDYSPAYDSSDPTDLLTYTTDIVIPADAVAVTIFHTPLVIDVNEASYGYTDNVSLIPVNTSPVDPPTSDNLIANGALAAGTTDAPTGWAQGGWGTNSRDFAYPVAGYVGDAARVTMTSYSSGDGKWYFAPVAVMPNEMYTFSHYYRSNVPTELVLQHTLADGSVQYEYVTGLTAATDWTENIFQFTTPVDVTAVTVFHNLAAVGYLEIDEASLVGEAGEPTEDTESPVVDFATLSDGDTLQEVATISVIATDNTGVDEVALFVDDVIVDTDIGAPFTLQFDTAGYSDGQYQLRAEAVDAAGNRGVSDEVLVTIDNSTTTGTTTPPTSENLVSNGDFAAGETGWNRGGWGSNDRTLEIATDASSDFAEVVVENYESGDAKWYFDPVAVVAGETYMLTHEYQATIETELLLQYTRGDGSNQYVYLAALPTSATWNEHTIEFTAPADVVTVTAFHLIAGNGTLQTANWGLYGAAGSSPDPDPEDTQNPTVSFAGLQNGDELMSGVVNIEAVATDNVAVASVNFLLNGTSIDVDTTAPYSFNLDTTTLANGAHQLALEAEDAAGNVGVSDEITVTISNSTSTPPIVDNLIQNGDLEDAAGGQPVGWNQGNWGDNEAVFTYPVTGRNGSAARVELNTHASGDAKWYFDDVDIVGDSDVMYEHWYRSDLPVDSIARITRNDGTVAYQYLGTSAVASDWTQFESVFTVSADAASVTVFTIVTDIGFLEIDEAQLDTTGA